MRPYSPILKQDGADDEDGEPLVAKFPNGKPFGAQYEQEEEIEIIRDIGHGRYGQVQFVFHFLYHIKLTVIMV